MGKLDLLKLSALIIMSIIFALISTPETTVGQDNEFPVVNNHRVLEDFMIPPYLISNSAQYIARYGGESVSLKEAKHYHEPSIFYATAFLEAWDASSERLAVSYRGSQDCEFPNVETNLIIYSVEADAASYHCLPFVYTDFDITWSPIDSNTLLINSQWIFRMDTNEILPIGELFPYPSLTTVTDMFIDYRDGARDYTALDKYIWDTSVDVPVFKVAYRETREANTEEMKRQFVMCMPWSTTLSFTSCTNAISVPEHTYVAYYDLSTQSPNMLLWVGIESSQDAPYLSVDLALYEDTVIYMSNLVTRETQELFRLSDMSDENLFFDVFADWSPNGETFAMNFGAYSGEERRQFVPDSDRTLLLTLDWDGISSDE